MDTFVADHKKFAHWLLDNAGTAFDPPMPTVDTTHISPTEAATEIANWVKNALGGQFIVPPAPFAASS